MVTINSEGNTVKHEVINIRDENPGEFICTKHYCFDDFLLGRDELGFPKAALQQLLTMYERTKEKGNPVILELGTRRGASTTVFLQVCKENGGHLYSIDVEDFSAVSDDPNFTFLQSDSTNIPFILNGCPELSRGIDVLLIDSLHKSSHVEKELYSWMPFLKIGALIFIDDIDPNPYRKGHRKDSLGREFDWQSMQDVILDAFHNNENDFKLEIIYGSTGLAIMTKCTPFGTPLKRGKKIIKRTYSTIWRFRIGLSVLKSKLLGRPY